MKKPPYNQTSSGRWDASGSWSEAVEEEHNKAAEWAYSLNDYQIRLSLIEMAEDPNAFTTYQRRALMLHVAEYWYERVPE